MGGEEGGEKERVCDNNYNNNNLCSQFSWN